MAKSKIKVWIDKDAFSDNVLRTQEMKKIVEEKAEELKWRCGEGYATYSRIGYRMAQAMVYPETKEARLDNSENNTLLKSIY